MWTPCLVLVFLAVMPRFQTWSRPSFGAVRTVQPSPKRIEELRTTIEIQRKLRAARRRMGERNREAVYQSFLANNSARRFPFPQPDKQGDRSSVSLDSRSRRGAICSPGGT
jgi:hypothetical protein